MNKTFVLLISFFFILSVHAQTADFNFSTDNGYFCSPSVVTFTQSCTGTPTGFIWDFGNGTFGDQAVQTVSYASAGSYTVKLIAFFGNTALNVSKVVVINPAGTAAISVDRSYICQPGIINFTGSGNGNITNYEWNFGDSSAITDVSYPAVSHTFTSLSTNNVTLTTTNDLGCKATASNTITVGPLPISGTESSFNGCIPASVNFAAAVTVPVGSTVTSYTWNYGDSSPGVVTTTNTTSRNYPKVGQYFPTLSVTTSEGCSNTYSFPKLSFGTPPTGLVDYPVKNPICGSETATFIGKATNADSYLWIFGDNSYTLVTDTFITHKYTTVGPKAVQVQPYYNGCAAARVGFPFSVIGVIAKFTDSNSCANKNMYSFRDTSSGNVSSDIWSFGDNSSTTSGNSVIHAFPVSGQFVTQLFVTDAATGCTDSVSKIIYTATPGLVTADTALCRTSPITFTIENNYTNSNATYTWSIVGTTAGPTQVSSITVNANVLGNYANNFVVIDNGQGTCKDTIGLNRPILIRGLNMDFTAPSALCFNTIFSVTNNSKPFEAADSALWYWNFGNAFQNDTVYQPAPFQYAATGNYTVKSFGIDMHGCSDSLIKNVAINALPFLHVLSQKNTLCYGLSDSLIAFHDGSILWTPATSLSCTACDTTIASPLVSTQYYATATNTANCSTLDSTFIQVSIPFTASINPADIFICQQQTTTVTVLPKGKVISWSPALGLSDANIYDPVITGIQSTVYTATLSDSTGCLSNSSSATLNVNVKSLPIVNAGPDATYPKGTTYSFTPTYSNNVTSYLWTPSDLLSCSNCAFPSGISKRSQNYIIQVTSDSGCVATDSVNIFIECKYANLFIPTAFTPNNDNLNDIFYPVTIGIKTITKFIIFDRRGQVMYEASNFSPNDTNFGWNGKFKGSDQSPGSYVYILEALCDVGEKLFKKGTVLLLR